MKKKKTIMFVGGGTGGSVSPLLAVANHYRDSSQYKLIFIGTKKGPEKKMVADWFGEMKFVAILSGKLRRYFSWRNFVDAIKVKLAGWQSLFILLRERPKVVISAGSFVAVPVSWAAWWLKIPVIIHQQDVRPGLANKLMAPIAKVITVTFEKSLSDFGKKAVWIGNPIEEIEAEEEIGKKYGIKSDFPVLMIIGGGTGAEGINNLVYQDLEDLSKNIQVIHFTGNNKGKKIKRENYISFPFLPHQETMSIMELSDVVISRAGIGVLTELSYFHKPSIIIPMPYSHQEDNAKLFADSRAAVVLNQEELGKGDLFRVVKEVLSQKEKKKELSLNISKMNREKADLEMVNIINNLI